MCAVAVEKMRTSLVRLAKECVAKAENIRSLKLQVKKKYMRKLRKKERERRHTSALAWIWIPHRRHRRCTLKWNPFTAKWHALCSCAGTSISWIYVPPSASSPWSISTWNMRWWLSWRNSHSHWLAKNDFCACFAKKARSSLREPKVLFAGFRAVVYICCVDVANALVVRTCLAYRECKKATEIKWIQPGEHLILFATVCLCIFVKARRIHQHSRPFGMRHVAHTSERIVFKFSNEIVADLVKWWCRGRQTNEDVVSVYHHRINFAARERDRQNEKGKCSNNIQIFNKYILAWSCYCCCYCYYILLSLFPLHFWDTLQTHVSTQCAHTRRGER